MTTILGYQFINSYGIPVGNTQPTLEDAEEVAHFAAEAGRFYLIEKTEHDQVRLHYLYNKEMA